MNSFQGFGKYILSALPDAKTKGVVIGFDGRHNSYRYTFKSKLFI